MDTYAYIKTLIGTTVTDHLTLKTVGSVIFTVGSFLFAGLSTNALIGLIILIVIDYITGILVAKKNGVLISSKQSLRTPVKVLVYYTMIACGHIVEFGVPAQIQFVDDTILTFLLITEFLSILKHFGNLGYKTPSKLINNLREQIGEKDIELPVK